MKTKPIKKIITLSLAGTMAISLLIGCGNANSNSSNTATAQENAEPDTVQASSKSNAAKESNEPEAAKETGKFDPSKEINVISREDGSGTRGAFIELFGIEQKNDDGEKADYTTDTAAITNSTAVMMQSVAGDLYSIGYISLGSMNDTVKAVKIDGVEATVENIKNGAYKIARPFNIVTREKVSDTAQDFIDFIMSADGQAVIEDNGYIPASEAEAYAGSAAPGKIVVSGSSSVSPVMEKLKEAYLAVNPDVTVEIQQSDSSTGVSNTIDGACDIGMASRELKDSEVEKGASSAVIAMDGIAVIVNNENPLESLTSEQVMNIYIGNAAVWGDITGK